MKHFIAEDFSALKKKRKSSRHFLKRGLKFLKKDHSKAIRLTGMIILVAAAAYLIDLSWFFRNEGGYFSGSRGSPVVIPKIERSDSGKIVSSFPTDILLYAEDGITESYSATYPNSPAKQATVEFISSKSPEANRNFYIQWAKDNGWDVVNSSESNLISFLYFRKASEQINMTIRASAKDAKSSDIIISYVNLNK